MIFTDGDEHKSPYPYATMDCSGDEHCRSRSSSRGSRSSRSSSPERQRHHERRGVTAPSPKHHRRRPSSATTSVASTSSSSSCSPERRPARPPRTRKATPPRSPAAYVSKAAEWEDDEGEDGSDGEGDSDDDSEYQESEEEESSSEEVNNCGYKKPGKMDAGRQVRAASGALLPQAKTLSPAVPAVALEDDLPHANSSNSFSVKSDGQRPRTGWQADLATQSSYHTISIPAPLRPEAPTAPSTATTPTTFCSRDNSGGCTRGGSTTRGLKQRRAGSEDQHAAKPKSYPKDDDRDHVKLLQGRKRKHECQHCGKVFPKPCKLARHVATHTGEKPFGCQEPG